MIRKAIFFVLPRLNGRLRLPRAVTPEKKYQRDTEIFVPGNTNLIIYSLLTRTIDENRTFIELYTLLIVF